MGGSVQGEGGGVRAGAGVEDAGEVGERGDAVQQHVVEDLPHHVVPVQEQPGEAGRLQQQLQQPAARRWREDVGVAVDEMQRLDEHQEDLGAQEDLDPCEQQRKVEAIRQQLAAAQQQLEPAAQDVQAPDGAGLVEGVGAPEQQRDVQREQRAVGQQRVRRLHDVLRVPAGGEREEPPQEGRDHGQVRGHREESGAAAARTARMIRAVGSGSGSGSVGWGCI